MAELRTEGGNEEIDGLRRRLVEAEETLHAIRNGGVDAFLVEEAGGHKVYTLEGADRPYRILVEQMHQGAAMLTAAGDIAYCNQRLAELLGVKHFKLVGQEFSEFLPPSERPRYDELLPKTLPEAGQCETLLQHVDGRKIPVLLTFNALDSASGLAVGVLVTDLTQQRYQERLNAALDSSRANEERYRSLFNSIDEGFCVLQLVYDAQGRVVEHIFIEANPALEKQSGLSDVVGRRSSELMPHLEQSWHDTYGQIVATGQSMRFVKEARGLGRWFDVYAFRLGEPEDGKVAVLFTDVTERRRSAEELKQARSRLVSTLSAAEIGTWEFDPIHDVVQADENLRKMFGVSREEAQGGALAVYTRAIHPDDVGQVESAIKAALEGDEDYEINYRLLPPGGGVRHVVARGRVERDADGLAVRLPGVVIDVTAERLAEEQLQASEIRRRLALDAAELGAWNIDPQTNTLTTDLRFRQIFGDTTAPISYTQAFELVHPDDRERVRQAIAAATDPQNPQPYSIEYRVVHPSDAMRWIFAQGRSHFEATPVGRKLVSFDGTIVDITERKKAEQDLQQLAANLAETDRRKDEFLATLAHELRNPLAPIKTAAQLMQLEGDEPEKLRELSLVIDRQVKQMVRLIDDLLDISRISRGKIKLQSHPCDLRDVVSVALEAAQPFIASSGQTLQVDVDGQPLWVNGDAARLAQIMINLLNNAAKYTPPAGKIWLSVVPDGDQVVLKVRDDGIGLPQSQLSNIFAMFEQVDVSKERGQSGLGIGLALVKTFVELHGGSVEAHSDGLGCGCEFRVRLPRLLDPPPSSLSDKHSLESSTSESKVNPDRGPLKILVVEDTRMIRYTLVRLLKVMGHEVMEARDGREGLDIALSFRPDVLFSDISMPHMNGHELASKIRGMESMRAVRLVALTGFGQEADRQLAFQSGFDHHLVKPVDAGVLAQFFEDLRRTAP